MVLITFHSNENFFDKELNDLKNNTVRIKDDKDDKRFDDLDRFEDIKEEGFYIRIKCREKFFTRVIKDVSIYDDLYIISWYSVPEMRSSEKLMEKYSEVGYLRDTVKYEGMGV